MAHTPDIRRRSDRPDRRMEDVIVRAQPNAGAGVLTRSLPSGTIIEAFPKRQRIPGSDHPFKLSLGQDQPFTIKVTPGLLYISATQVKPKINNEEMDADPPPTVAISQGDHYIVLSFKALPVIRFQPIDEVNIYYLLNSILKTGTQAIIRAISTAAWPPSTAALAEINYRTGVVKEGEFHIAIGRVRRTGGNEAALTILDQYWKTNMAFTMTGDGDMFLAIR